MLNPNLVRERSDLVRKGVANRNMDPGIKSQVFILAMRNISCQKRFPGML